MFALSPARSAAAPRTMLPCERRSATAGRPDVHDSPTWPACSSGGVALMEWFTDPEIWIALVTLTALEIVLGIDNLIFISILSSKLPLEQQPRARRLGLGA